MQNFGSIFLRYVCSARLDARTNHSGTKVEIVQEYYLSISSNKNLHQVASMVFMNWFSSVKHIRWVSWSSCAVACWTLLTKLTPTMNWLKRDIVWNQQQLDCWFNSSRANQNWHFVSGILPWPSGSPHRSHVMKVTHEMTPWSKQICNYKRRDRYQMANPFTRQNTPPIQLKQSPWC